MIPFITPRSTWVKRLTRFLLIQLMTPVAFGAVLFSTDFSAATTGDDQLIGSDGWKGNSASHGISGIGENLVPGLGKSAWLGYGPSTTNLVRVYRDINSTSSSSQPARIIVDAIIGVEASISGGSDLFAISLYNTGGVFLASLRFDTAIATYGIWVDNGQVSTETGASISLNQLHAISLDIDFQQNLWTVYIDGALLLTQTKFTASLASRNAGSLAVEWEIADMANPGDNWILFDNLTVTSPDLQLTSVTRATNGFTSISWIAPKSGYCQLQTSNDLVTWSDLPGATVLSASAGATLSYTDKTGINTLTGNRFYRIKQ